MLMSLAEVSDVVPFKRRVHNLLSVDEYLLSTEIAVDPS